jgi:hypothetical protein
MEVINMTITIASFTVDTSYNHQALAVEHGKVEFTKGNHLPITYWGIYIDDKYISYTSSKELAEKTKVWIEKWLKDRL